MNLAKNRNNLRNPCLLLCEATAEKSFAWVSGSGLFIVFFTITIEFNKILFSRNMQKIYKSSLSPWR